MNRGDTSETSVGNRQESGRKLHQLELWRLILLLPLGVLIKLWARTLRVSITPEEQKLVSDTRDPQILLVWHNRLFFAGEFYRRFRRPRQVYAMVSASRDGAWLVAFLRLVGIQTVRGSRNYRAVEGVRGLVRQLRSGHDVAITPDGSTGPLYVCKPGGALVARVAKAPVLLLSFNYSNAWRLNTWDRFFLPKPFSQVELRCRRFDGLDEIPGMPSGGTGVHEEAAMVLQGQLMALSGNCR